MSQKLVFSLGKEAEETISNYAWINVLYFSFSFFYLMKNKIDVYLQEREDNRQRMKKMQELGIMWN